MKYKLHQIIYYMRDNRPHSAPILSRVCVENGREIWPANEVQEGFFARFGKAGVTYATCHGEIAESAAFASKEELLNSLK
jgi:hypothetical protein